jgi:hypothetical protein
MPLVLIDRAQETATANTTVSFTLTGASTGYQTLAGVGNTNTTYYGATDGTNWETGLGTYSTTGPTLTRTTILASSNTGAAVTFSGAVTVWVDYPAGQAVYEDAANLVTGYAISGGSINNTPIGATTASTGRFTTLESTASQTANIVYASPNGSSGAPTFRALVSTDIPDLLLTKLPEAWVKMSTDAATTANITLSGTQTVDGVALIAGNRCLVKNQTLAQDNGIYDVSATAWARSADANTISEIAGAAVNIDAGTVNGGKVFDTDLKTTDTLGTTAMNWYSLVDINGGTFVGGLTLRAGTATAGTSPLKFQTGTLLTTAEAGAVEYLGNTFYASAAASTRGVLPTEQWVVLTGTNTLTSQTGVQPIFDGGGGPTNGSVSLPIGTYQFECVYALTSMSATSGSFGFSIAGGTGPATFTFSYDSTASKAGTGAATAQAGFKLFSSAAATALVTNSTGTVGSAVIKGIIRVTVAGTVIPQVSLTVAAAAIVSANSYFKVSPLGNVSTVAQVGNWA